MVSLLEQEMIEIEISKRYTRNEVALLLELTDIKLKKAEEIGLIKFDQGGLYGLYLFQYLRQNVHKLEQVQQE